MAEAEATETTATEDATMTTQMIATIDAATARDPVIEMWEDPIGIETADETDQGHATGHTATEAHQETVVTVAIATATTPGALETAVAEGLGEAMGHRNIEMVCVHCALTKKKRPAICFLLICKQTRGGDLPLRAAAQVLARQNYPPEANTAAKSLAHNTRCQSESMARMTAKL